MSNLSRRHLLKTAAAGSTLFAGALTTAHATPIEPMPQKWDETFDIVVIGSGFAGLAAAIEARKAGASVCVLEKMRTIGGNSIINGGIMGVPGTPMQKKQGYKDSPELMAEDMIREGAGLNHPDKVLHLCREALPTWEWTVKELGVDWVQERVSQEGGHTVPRCAILKTGSGSEIVNKEIAKLKELGVKPRTRVFMEKIIRDADGRVKGVQVREGYKFPDANSGKVKFICARKAVVLAHGGFGADVAFRSQQDPKLTEKVGTTCQPGATSELWRETMAIGCLQVQDDWIQCGPWTSPREKGMGIGWQFSQTAAAEYGIWVNSEGNRFVNELANRKVRADAIMLEQQAGRKAFAIAQGKNVEPLKKQRPGFLEKMLEMKIVSEYKTLEDLAKKLDMPVENVKKTFEAYWEAHKTGVDKAFGRPEMVIALDKGPWYAAKITPGIHHTMGGVTIDPETHVLTKDGKVIQGLFAAGEVTGGVHGGNRIGGNAVTDIVTFGRIAGTNAAAYAKTVK